MPTMNFFVLTSAQRDIAVTLDDDENTIIAPRAVDSATPGVGINLNDQAQDYTPGAAVTLAGTFAAPKRIVDDPSYQQYCPALITYLLTLPWCSLESETIFAPQVVD